MWTSMQKTQSTRRRLKILMYEKLLEELGFETVSKLPEGQHAADQRILAALVAKKPVLLYNTSVGIH